MEKAYQLRLDLGLAQVVEMRWVWLLEQVMAWCLPSQYRSAPKQNGNL